MSLPLYGVLKGTITDKLDSKEAIKKNPKGSPHYELKVAAAGKTYRVAVNVKSDQKPANLQVFRSEHYSHPILDKFKSIPVGYTHLASNHNTGALDYIRWNLFDLSKMTILPADGDPSGNDLNDIFNVYIEQAMHTKDALVYAFGSAWHDATEDPYFHFKPGDGIHDIHMNQGNKGSHAGDNGTYQDGGFFIYYPDENRWLAVFLKFQSQHVVTSNNTADPVEVTVDNLPEVVTPVTIFAALVNPTGDDTGKEEVYLLNASPETINMDGWAIMDKAQNKDIISGLSLKAGDVYRYRLAGNGAQLSNNGGIITLLNKEGIKVSGVAYTAQEAATQGKVLKF